MPLIIVIFAVYANCAAAQRTGHWRALCIEREFVNGHFKDAV